VCIAPDKYTPANTRAARSRVHRRRLQPPWIVQQAQVGKLLLQHFHHGPRPVAAAAIGNSLTVKGF
jgi:hypothetical protein